DAAAGTIRRIERAARAALPAWERPEPRRVRPGSERKRGDELDHLPTLPRTEGQRTIGRDVRGPSAFPVGDAPAREIVRRELNLDPVTWVDADPITAHPPGRVAERHVAVVEGDPVHPALERLRHLALQLNFVFLFGHHPPSERGGWAQ